MTNNYHIEIEIETYIGIGHFMRIQDLCSEVIRKYGFNYSLASYENKIQIIISDNGDIDADTLGAFSNELQLEIGIYLHENCPSSIDPES